MGQVGVQSGTRRRRGGVLVTVTGGEGVHDRLTMSLRLALTRGREGCFRFTTQQSTIKVS